jgi:hypothetical protein
MESGLAECNRLMPIQQRFLFRKLLPIVAVAAFITMVAIGERQVRSSPKWPPPARHELGGWEIEYPPVLTSAAFLNLPASIPILWIWAHNDAFAYAFEDPYLIVYLPWIFLARCLWYFVGYRIDQIFGKGGENSSRQRYIVICGQALVSGELLYAALAMGPVWRGTEGRVPAVCLWAWLPLAALGWLGLMVKRSSVQPSSSQPQAR